MPEVVLSEDVTGAPPGSEEPGRERTVDDHADVVPKAVRKNLLTSSPIENVIVNFVGLDGVIPPRLFHLLHVAVRYPHVARLTTLVNLCQRGHCIFHGPKTWWLMDEVKIHVVGPEVAQARLQRLVDTLPVVRKKRHLRGDEDLA